MFNFLHKETFDDIYEELSRYDYSRWVNPFWKDNLDRLYNLCKWGISERFALDPNFYGFNCAESEDSRSMFKWMKENSPENLLGPDPVYGGMRDVPVFNVGVRDRILYQDIGMEMTTNSIFHAYVFATYMKMMDRDIADYKSIVHWGGGFGNQTRLLRRLNPNYTECIVDLPLVSMIQYAYLTHSLVEEHGEEMGEKVNLLVLPGDEIKEGHINLVPLPFLEKVPDCEWFISTHALSESSAASQDYVCKDRKWYGAKDLLLAWMEDHPDFPDGPNWMEIIQGLRLRHLGMPGLPSTYNFAR